MKKWTIWLLTIVMACTFLGLLSVQIMYLENMVKMRNEQFSETVMRSLYGVAATLEQDETRYYLDKDLEGTELNFDFNRPMSLGETMPDITSQELKLPMSNVRLNSNGRLVTDGVNYQDQYQRRQDILKGQYLYQRGLLNEVILSILNQASDRPITERADSAVVSEYLKQELERNGLSIPYEFAVVNRTSGLAYKTQGFVSVEGNPANEYTQVLFPNDPVSKQNVLKVSFPTKSKYIFSSVKFLIPSFIFTFILLGVFIYTIITIFRQKKLTEIKNDFINNMTHEFKTPISSISLAAQMLNDETVRKSPAMLKQASTVINDETKRLRFQVEKVLQMSMFDRKKATMRLDEVDAHAIIDSVINTYKLKVEKFGGHIEAHLDAEDSIVNVDEMHFTNVIFNLLDNAIKYRREDVKPELKVTTRNVKNNYLEVKIADNGIGIKREDLKKIFEKFYRVSTGNRHDVKGFGLGLAYVSKMITLFNGTIKAESDYGKGSTFIITLPLMQ